jgi:hypothetical protein
MHQKYVFYVTWPETFSFPTVTPLFRAGALFDAQILLAFFLTGALSTKILPAFYTSGALPPSLAATATN